MILYGVDTVRSRSVGPVQDEKKPLYFGRTDLGCARRNVDRTWTLRHRPFLRSNPMHAVLHALRQTVQEGDGTMMVQDVVQVRNE
jgi:hypothetical protein